MIIFNNYFYYFIVLINIIIGCYNDMNNIKTLKLNYIEDIFIHKNHIYAYILCRCYFNGSFIGFLLYHIVYLSKIINMNYIKHFFTIFLFLTHCSYLIKKYNINNTIEYKDILAIYGFHTGYVNLINL